ncbi:integrase/recombinase xerD homolog [Eublepharis macularius]|uniref:Integrase/recombinase xerD homolog n=1 Tax=Eublepharis macularius TaxID=481883 RepID=A0AA97KGL9_EUBMA|nr:integrase/recombinase xerD homolog [Eublepharis macularius]
MQGVLCSVAPSTLRAYSAALTRFLAFAVTAGGDGSWPTSQVVVLQYLVHLRGLGLSPRSMRRDLAAISFFSKAQGFPDPCSGFIVRRALTGWARLAPLPPDRRRPITLDILERVLHALPGLCWSPGEARLFRAAFMVAFYGAFRVSEIVAGSRSDTSGRALAASDLTCSPRLVTITLRRSKTDQRGRGSTVTLRAARRRVLCPVRAVRAFLDCRPLGPGPLFIHEDGSPLSRYQFSSVLRACLLAAGLPPMQFGSHSFRIGAATVAAGLGLPPSVIQSIGRWRSSAFRSYIRPTGEASH